MESPISFLLRFVFAHNLYFSVFNASHPCIHTWGEKYYNRYWLTVRDEQIIAKGKGAMTTYWCEPRSFQSRSKHGSSNSGTSLSGSSNGHHDDLDESVRC